MLLLLAEKSCTSSCILRAPGELHLGMHNISSCFIGASPSVVCSSNVFSRKHSLVNRCNHLDQIFFLCFYSLCLFSQMSPCGCGGSSGPVMLHRLLHITALDSQHCAGTQWRGGGTAAELTGCILAGCSKRRGGFLCRYLQANDFLQDRSLLGSVHGRTETSPSLSEQKL